MTLLPEVESALLGAIRTQQRAPRRRVFVPAVTVALVSLTLVVAVGALVVLRHHHAEAPGSGGGARMPVSRQQLIDTLGVLRRPQAGPGLDDHALLALLARRGNLDSALVRTVTVPRLHDTVALLPVTVASRTGSAVTEQLAVSFLTPGRGAQAPITEAVGIRVLRAHGIAAVFAPAVNDYVLVVPDGVLRVRIDHVTAYGLRHLELRRPPRTPMTATVHDNVAGFALGPLVAITAGTSRVEGVPAVAQTTWLGPAGRVIARPQVHLVVWVVFPSAHGAAARRVRSLAFCQQNPSVC